MVKDQIQQQNTANDASQLSDGKTREPDALYWLAMDTATSNMSLAVMNRLQTVAVSDSAVERNHSVKLIPEIERLLQNAGIRMKDIQAVVTGHGPGSYTGVRISVTVAKTLAWSLGIPLLSVSSIGALAWGYVRAQVEQDTNAFLPNEPVWVIPILDGRRSQVYTSLHSVLVEAEDFKAESVDSQTQDARMKINHRVYRWRQLERDRIVPFLDWTQHITDMVGQTDEQSSPVRMVFVGETEKFVDAAKELEKALGIPVAIEDGTVHGQDLAWLAWDRLNRGETDEVHSLTPNYTQLAEAEQKLLSRQK